MVWLWEGMVNSYFQEIQNLTTTCSRVILSETYHSLHRLSANGMKLCGFVGLAHVSIAVDLKSSKNLANRSKSGDKLGSPSQKLTSGIFPF